VDGSVCGHRGLAFDASGSSFVLWRLLTSPGAQAASLGIGFLRLIEQI
jgi:hypothetical protein